MRRVVAILKRRGAHLAASTGLLALAFAVAFSSFSADVAKAGIFDDWMYDGGGDWSEGYFSNAGWHDMNDSHRANCGYGGNCPVLPNGNYSYDAINGAFRDGNSSIAQSIQRARDLVAQLKAYNRSGDNWSQAGSAFIANTLLGYGSDHPSKTRSPSDAMWAEIETRLVDRASKGRINWNINFYSDGRDTYSKIIYNTDGVWRYDIVYNSQVDYRNGIIIYNDNGTEAYKLWYLCGNPIGNLSGVPVASYNLTPTITGTPSNSEGGTPVSLTPTVNNGGPGTPVGNQWQITTFNLAPGASIPGGGTNNRTPVQHYGNGATVVASGTRNYSVGVNNIAVTAQTIGDLPVGSRVCYTLSVQPYNHTTSDWRHGTPFCVTIAKKPKVQILGHDLIVGKGMTSHVTTSSTTKTVSGSSRTYGSWGEYAAVASGAVTGFASGSGYGNGGPSSLFCDVSLLTFTNAGTNTCTPSTPKGGYTITKALPDISGRLAPTANLGNNPTVDVTTVTQAVYSASGNVTVTASGQIPKGKWVIINAPTATVTINSNIAYTNDALQQLTDIPQVVIIANEIRISPSVSNIDAWLIASGTNGNIYTCNEVSVVTQLHAGRCSNRLTVNGPVVARHLYLWRTAGAGAGTQTGEPAEVFNLRPDAYLWATGFTAGAGRLQTVMTQELPPRF